MVLSQIVKHLAYLSELAGFQLIISTWIEMTVLGALTVKPYVRYLPGTEYELLGAGSCNLSDLVAACGLSRRMNFISEITSVIKLTSMLPLSWAGPALQYRYRYRL